jgi:phosphate transport system permease protein
MTNKLFNLVKNKLTINKKHAKEEFIKLFLFLSAIVAVVVIFSILYYLFSEAYVAFSTIGVWDFITGTDWKPEGIIYGFEPSFGALPLIAGTLITTLGAMIIAVPLSIGSAIFISELAPPKIKEIAKPIVELLAGIPSVVYGFFGVIVLTDWLRISFDVPSGKGWFAGSILLGIMALPTITSVAEDAISSVPRQYVEGSLAVGATRWQTISKVILPASLSGITAAIILGMGRAIGETMAVLMVTGNTDIMPNIGNLFSTVKTLTGAIAIEMNEAPAGSIWQHSLFGLAFILLVITLIINLSSNIILKRLKEKHMAAKASAKKRKISLNLFQKNSFEKIRKKINYVIGIIGLITILWLFGIIASFIVLVFILSFYFLKKKISPKNAQRIAFGLIITSILIVIGFLGIIVWDIVSNGIGALNWEFLTQGPRDLGREGGIFPAIVGTFYLAIGAIVIALPIGVFAAIYLTEYTKEGKITKIIRTGADLLNGTPSIVFGLFGFAFLVLALGWGRSLLAGQITLAFMILPTIIRTTEEAITSVPQSVREGSYALGASKWQTVKRVVLPPSLPGIMTGAILGIGRAAGETAPILFTAVIFSSRFLPSDLFKPVMALPYHLYILATTVPNSKDQQYGTALVLLIVVIILYATAIIIRQRYRKKMKW